MGAQNCCSKQEEDKNLEIKGGQLTKELLNIEKEKYLNNVKEIKMEENKLGLETSNQDLNEEINIKEIQPPKEENPNKNEITVNTPHENPNIHENSEINIDSDYLFLENFPQELSNFTFIEKYLYLNCPKCKEIPFLNINEANPEFITIKCDKCNTELELNLKSYLSNLSSENLSKNKKSICNTHHLYNDRLCMKCHDQYCAKCEIYNKQHSDHIIIRIKTMTTSKYINEWKDKIKEVKEYLKKYISDFFNDELIIQKTMSNKNINNLVKTYINTVKSFYLFCDNILLNIDPVFPDYFQQKNLIALLEILDKELLMKNFFEQQLKNIYLFEYQELYQEQYQEPSRLEDLINIVDDKISDALFIKNEFIILALENISLKVYNYKNKKYIATIENNFGEKDIKFYKIKLSQIDNNIFSVILINSEISIIKLFSINENNLNLIFEKTFNSKIYIIKKIHYNTIGIVFENYFEIYSTIDNFENILQKKTEFEFKKKINIPEEIKDFFKTSDDLYIIIACFRKIYIYQTSDFSILKQIEIPFKKEIIYSHINILDDNNIIFFGENIGVLTLNNSSFELLWDEKRVEEIKSYLAAEYTYLKYSNFVLTSNNKLIFERKLTNIIESHYGDHTTYEESVYISNYNSEKYSLSITKNFDNLKVVNIHKNLNNEIIIVQEDKVSILYI